jgi:N-acetylneuraminic acid mutarotase
MTRSKAIRIGTWTLVASLGSVTIGEEAVRLPDLTIGVTSHGAAVIGDYLYLYGGHMGGAHHYSTESQSDKLQRLNIRQPDGWSAIATGPRLQGLALVAHGNMLYRIGGFTAQNPPGEENDLQSISDVAQFDPTTKKWNEMPALPEPRSSMDAVVVGDRIYVAGGWSLGKGPPKWHETAWYLDLAAKPGENGPAKKRSGWQPIANPPFQRRAASLGHLDGKVYVIGGIEADGQTTTETDIYDPATDTWQPGPKLNGKGMEGFGTSAFELNGQLFVTSYSGKLQRLAATGWENVGELNQDRFFHRMVPWHDSLLVVGGASMEDGKRLTIEVLTPTDKKQSVNPKKTGDF